MSIPTVRETSLPLELIRRGKVREIYRVDEQHLLMVTSDRISAFDVVMEEPVPFKGAVLTQLSAFWFSELRTLTPSHFVSADVNDIVARVPQVSDAIEELRGRSMLVRRTDPLPFECVVRGYISGSAWAEYRQKGTLAGEPLPEGLVESQQLKPPIFSPATKAETGHDENVTFGRVREDLGEDLARKLRELSLRLYQAGRDLAAARDLIIADTKFEFGTTDSGELLLIDEVLTPDSSRFWPSDEYEPGRAQRSFDKQPLRDHLAELKGNGRWNGDPPPPPLPSEVVNSTSERYLDAYRRITGTELLENL